MSWMVGHLANQEQRYWLLLAQGQILVPEVQKCASGAPRSTPDLNEMWAAWHKITQAADPYLDSLTDEALRTFFVADGKPVPESIGTMMRRMTYHYWYHLGESQAVRQLLGHTDLPGFVGNMSSATYRG
jgi:hypothetical protein